MKKPFISFILLVGLFSELAATTGFLIGEKVSGLNRICYYDVLGSTYTLNVPAYEICPVTYDF